MGGEEVLVPLLVELLVLLDVSLLALLSLLSLVEDKLLVSPVVVLDAKFSYSVFGHLSLYILALLFTCLPVVLERFAKDNKHKIIQRCAKLSRHQDLFHSTSF